MSIAKNLKECRLAANMSQEQVAEQLFVTRQTVSGWETGRTQPDLETLGKLTALYGVGLDRVIYGVDYDDKKAGLRKKLILASRIFAGVVVAGMLISVVWRLYLGSYWPPMLNGVQDWWYTWYDYHENCAKLFRMGLRWSLLAMLILDAAVGDVPKLGRRWKLWAGTLAVVLGISVAGDSLSEYWKWLEFTVLPVVNCFLTPTLYMLLSTAIWLVRKRVRK